MTNKKTIAVDVDDVLGGENDAVREFMNAKYGFSHSTEDYLQEGPYWGYWESVWGVGPEKGAEMYEEYVKAGVKATHRPVTGSIEAINRLKQDYKLVIVTMRGDRHVEHTHKWLETHFPSTFERVEFLPLWGDKNEITKAQIATEIGAAYLIDDSVEHCTLADEAGIQAVLFGDYGWNRAFKATGSIHRAKDWQAVLEFFYGKNR